MRKITKVSLCLVLLLLFSCSVFVSPAQAYTIVFRTTVVQSSDNPVLAKAGDSKYIVQEVKVMLKELRYMNYYGEPSSYYSTITRYAVYYFQKNNSLNATGMLDRNTYNAIVAKYNNAAGNTAPTPTPTPTPTTTPTPTPTPAPTSIGVLTADEKQMFDLINQERAKAGVAPLQIDTRLIQSARAKSQDMITNNYFSHTSPTWGSFSVIIRQFAGNGYSYLGENLAGAPGVTTAHINLMNSDGHRKNILNPNYTYVGIGIVNGGPYGKMMTQHFGGK